MKKIQTDKEAGILLAAALILCWLFVLQYGIFGSRVDWISQHSVLPDYFRQRFYATGNLFPDIAWNLGGGQNIYNFSYYGLFSPVILFSYLLPFVPMGLYIMASSMAAYGASAVLFYQWIKKKFSGGNTGFWTACMFALAGPLIFHSYNQIMFVNYMPFLCLALIGTDRFLQKNKKGLLLLGTTGMILTSFYFSVGGILALGLYGAGTYIAQTEKFSWKDFGKKAGGFTGPLILSVCLCGILLVPTALVLLSRESGGNTTEGMGLFSISPLRFFYSPYGVGLTYLSLGGLMGNLLRKESWKKKILPAGLLLILFVPVFGYLLNGGLYVKDKVFIPFLPLVCLETGKYVENLRKGRDRSGWADLLIQVLPGIFLIGYSLFRESAQGISQKWLIGGIGLAVAADMTFFLLSQKIYGKFPRFPWPLLFSVGILFFSGWAMNSQWKKMLPAGDYEEIIKPEKTDLIKETLEKAKGWYRMEELEGGTQEFADMNRIRDIGQNISSIYSSAYNQDYAGFRNKTFQVNRHFRNCLMEAATDNPIFLNLMGVRYVTGNRPPAGYTLLKKKGDTCLYENEKAFPLAFVTDRVISEKEYQELSFPDNQSVLLQYGVIEKADQEKPGKKKPISSMKACSLELPVTENQNIQIRKTEKGYEIHALKETEITAQLSGRGETDDLLAVKFHVKNQNLQRDMYIRLEGQTNRLSAEKGYEYANKNQDFSYTVTTEKQKDKAVFIFGKGSYIIEDIQIFTGNLEELREEKLCENPLEGIWFSEGGDRLTGAVRTEKQGYLITSIPYDKNFKITVDGENVEKKKVNTAFLGAKIPKGVHSISISYQAPGKNAGLFLTGGGLVCLAVLVMGRLCRRLLAGCWERNLVNRKLP